MFTNENTTIFIYLFYISDWNFELKLREAEIVTVFIAAC